MVCLFGLPSILIKHLNLVRVEPSYTFFPRRGGVGEFNPRTRFPLSVATQVHGTLLQAFSLKDGEPRSLQIQVLIMVLQRVSSKA